MFPSQTKQTSPIPPEEEGRRPGGCSEQSCSSCGGDGCTSEQNRSKSHHAPEKVEENLKPRSSDRCHIPEKVEENRSGGGCYFPQDEEENLESSSVGGCHIVEENLESDSSDCCVPEKVEKNLESNSGGGCHVPEEEEEDVESNSSDPPRHGRARQNNNHLEYNSLIISEADRITMLPLYSTLIVENYSHE